ncbi:Arc family DNA-binding protein [Paenirhodobacter populi]|nr:Arc family DNA-binding protein [Sinirhodobacter populi]
MLRLPDGMRDQIKSAAARECRSMNAEIVRHLRTIYQPAEKQEDVA